VSEFVQLVTEVNSDPRWSAASWYSLRTGELVRVPAGVIHVDLVRYDPLRFRIDLDRVGDSDEELMSTMLHRGWLRVLSWTREHYVDVFEWNSQVANALPDLFLKLSQSGLAHPGQMVEVTVHRSDESYSFAVEELLSGGMFEARQAGAEGLLIPAVKSLVGKTLVINAPIWIERHTARGSLKGNELLYVGEQLEILGPYDPTQFPTIRVRRVGDKEVGYATVWSVVRDTKNPFAKAYLRATQGFRRPEPEEPFESARLGEELISGGMFESKYDADHLLIPAVKSLVGKTVTVKFPIEVEYYRGAYVDRRIARRILLSPGSRVTVTEYRDSHFPSVVVHPEGEAKFGRMSVWALVGNTVNPFRKAYLKAGRLQPIEPEEPFESVQEAMGDHRRMWDFAMKATQSLLGRWLKVKPEVLRRYPSTDHLASLDQIKGVSVDVHSGYVSFEGSQVHPVDLISAIYFVLGTENPFRERMAQIHSDWMGRPGNEPEEPFESARLSEAEDTTWWSDEKLASLVIRLIGKTFRVTRTGLIQVGVWNKNLGLWEWPIHRSLSKGDLIEPLPGTDPKRWSNGYMLAKVTRIGRKTPQTHLLGMPQFLAFTDNPYVQAFRRDHMMNRHPEPELPFESIQEGEAAFQEKIYRLAKALEGRWVDVIPNGDPGWHGRAFVKRVRWMEDMREGAVLFRLDHWPPEEPSAEVYAWDFLVETKGHPFTQYVLRASENEPEEPLGEEQKALPDPLSSYAWGYGAWYHPRYGYHELPPKETHDEFLWHHLDLFRTPYERLANDFEGTVARLHKDGWIKVHVYGKVVIFTVAAMKGSTIDALMTLAAVLRHHGVPESRPVIFQPVGGGFLAQGAETQTTVGALLHGEVFEAVKFRDLIGEDDG